MIAFLKTLILFYKRGYMNLEKEGNRVIERKP